MISAFGVDHGEINKAAYFALPTARGAKESLKRGLKAPKVPRKKPAAPPLKREDYVAPDGVQVRWRGGG
jgi:hypothetical protein